MAPPCGLSVIYLVAVGFRRRRRRKQANQDETLRWTKIAAFIGAAGIVIGAVVAIAIAVFDGGSEDRETAEASATDSLSNCLRGASQREFAEFAIDTWYCETEFANFWRQTKPTMLPANKPVLREYFAHLDPRRDRQDLGVTDQAREDPGAVEGFKLTRLFNDWPSYESRFAGVIGRVAELRKLSQHGSWSDWVVQLATDRDDGVLLYARFSVAADWKPRPQSKCDVGFVEGIPVARGYTNGAGTNTGSYDVIYEMATMFACFSRQEALQMGREIRRRSPELVPSLERGMDPDAW